MGGKMEILIKKKGSQSLENFLDIVNRTVQLELKSFYKRIVFSSVKINMEENSIFFLFSERGEAFIPIFSKFGDGDFDIKYDTIPMKTFKEVVSFSKEGDLLTINAFRGYKLPK